MAGLVQVFLTDHELDIILAWADIAAPFASGYGSHKEEALQAKLTGIRLTLECGCEGGACDV